MRVGTLKGGGPGKEGGVELGLSRTYYDSLFELENALVTQAYDKYTLGAAVAVGDPFDGQTGCCAWPTKAPSTRGPPTKAPSTRGPTRRAAASRAARSWRRSAIRGQWISAWGRRGRRRGARSGGGGALASRCYVVCCVGVETYYTYISPLPSPKNTQNTIHT